MNLPFSILGFTHLKIFVLNASTWFTNSGLSWSSGINCNFCKSDSSSVGLTNVAQSLSLKKCLTSQRILLRFSIFSLLPFCSARLFSKYCFGLIGLSYSSRSKSAKSLTTHRNRGKYLWISSGSHSPIRSFLIYNCFDRFMINDKFWIAFSSIVPIELKMK